MHLSFVQANPEVAMHRIWLAAILAGSLLVSAVPTDAAASTPTFEQSLAQVENLLNRDIPVALAQTRRILAGANAANDGVWAAEAERVLGVALNLSGQNEQALIHLDRASAAFTALGMREKIPLIARNKGVCLLDMGRHEDALQSYFLALEGFQALGATLEIAKTHANIANVHLENDQAEDALRYQRLALTAFEKAKWPLGIAGSALNLSAALVQRAQALPPESIEAKALTGEARQRARQALSIFSALGITRGVIKARGNLATLSLDAGDFDAAQRELRVVRRLAVKAGDPIEEVAALEKLTRVALMRRDWQTALGYAETGLKLEYPSLNLGAIETFHSGASEALEQLGKPDLALQHERRASETSKQIIEGDIRTQVASLTKQYEDRQKDRELAVLRQDQALDQTKLSKERSTRNGAIIISALTLGMLAVLWSRFRLRDQSRRELEQAAVSDPLTGLLNRRGLRNLIVRGDMLREGHALILCDIDNFKRINDVYGHDVGDLVLQQCALNLRNALRTGDCAARWGGEEFLLLAHVQGVGDAAQVAERLRASISEATLAGVPRELKVSISLGVANSFQGATLDELVHAADQALLQAKSDGKNRVVMANPKIRAVAGSVLPQRMLRSA